MDLTSSLTLVMIAKYRGNTEVRMRITRPLLTWSTEYGYLLSYLVNIYWDIYCHIYLISIGISTVIST